MVLSRAYQLPAVNLGENRKDFVFRGPVVRRLSAEQFRDALTTLTGIGYATADTDVVSNDMEKKFTPAVDIKWIWSQTNAAVKAKAEYLYFRKEINFQQTPGDAKIFVVCDNSFTLFVNGKKIGAGADFTKEFLYDIRSDLREGKNVIAIEAVNFVAANVPPTSQNVGKDSDNPAGLVVYARVRGQENGAEKVMDFASDKTWIFSSQKISEWEQEGFTAQDWTNAAELGGVTMQPWRLAGNYFAARLGVRYSGNVRAALVAADPLTVALGRPNREQIVTTRPVEATTLQALEMTNGETLADILQRAASRLSAEKKVPDNLIRDIYEQALGRKPSATEKKMAEQIIGKNVQKEGVEDFLWAMTMLPEFQLIY
ncbi:MAG: DUF1553 domain-containing protein, partial [Verrucomicrobiota bacterium]